jgi:iron(III) transport system ATP-binding protein
LEVGKKATIVIRPEGLHLSRKDEEAFFKGTVTHAVYLGSTMEYELTVPNRTEPVVAISYNPVLEGFYKEGDTVGISFDPVSAHVIR